MCQEKMKIAVVNGSNINILGIRQPDIYGTETWNCIEERLVKLADKLKVQIMFFQSNHEGDIVDFIQENMMKLDGIVINPAAFTSHGFSILDALMALPTPFVEVHLSNIFAREQSQKETIFAEKAVGHINGFCGYVYELGLLAIWDYLKKNRSKI